MGGMAGDRDAFAVLNRFDRENILMIRDGMRLIQGVIFHESADIEN